MREDALYINASVSGPAGRVVVDGSLETFCALVRGLNDSPALAPSASESPALLAPPPPPTEARR